MRSEKYKQVIAICESNADAFQERMNDSLARVADPDIVFDRTRPFTAYITYRVRKDVPEDILELLELLDGETHYCEDCPYLTLETDKRRKWGSCSLKGEKTKPDSRACEHFYLWRLKQYKQIAAEYKEIPFQIEG